MKKVINQSTNAIQVIESKQLQSGIPITAQHRSFTSSSVLSPMINRAYSSPFSNTMRKLSCVALIPDDTDEESDIQPKNNNSASSMITVSQMTGRKKLLDGSIVNIKKNESKIDGGKNSSRNTAGHQQLTYQKMNFVTAINDAIRIAMRTDETAILFGEDVAFGGVFRVSNGLQDEFGKQRVFNTPISEGGIAGMAIGYAATMGGTAIGEIQFADYIFPAMDQIVNELAKFRYRSGNQWNAGGVTLRSPCGAVGHGGHYHSQSPEAYLAHTPGIVTVMPSTPITAKGLLLASIRSPDPVIFLEPKILYRSAIEEVPIDDYEIPIGKARIVQEGTDVTIIGWGGQVRVLQTACNFVKEQYNISCELIDLQTIVPMDTEALVQSVKKTGRCIVSHEAPITCGYGAEIVATIQEQCFWNLVSPIQRVCGYDMPFPLITEKLYVPDHLKNIQAILKVVDESK
jgi:2-oxoisovalerate dehydrogenase E1 component beta subunit